ncbi:MAG: hypothetical protein ACTSRS_13105 [Candidatus Helarchaeota archaeon]
MNQHSRSTSKKDSYELMEEEFKYARWFWAKGDLPQWDSSKLFLTFLATLFILLTGLIGISPFISPVTTGIVLGSLILFTILLNTNLREAIQRRFVRRHYDQTVPVTSYQQLKFYFLEGKEDVLFLENGRDLTAIGLFKLKAVPLVIKGNFERFIRSLYQQQIPIWWTYVQAPVAQGAVLASPAVSEEARAYYQGQPDYEFHSRLESRNGIWVARLIFGTRRTIPVLTHIEAARLNLYQQITADLFKIQTAFVSAYPHTVLEPLVGHALEKAISISLTGGGMPAFF